MSTARNVDDLAELLYAIQGQIRALGRPRLANASTEGFIEVVDPTFGGTVDPESTSGETQTAAIIGRQYDGTVTAASVAGPTPPTPTTPIVQPVVGGLLIGWDGEWTNALVAPMDFARIEVHVGISHGFPALDASTLVGTIETPRGASVYVPLPDYDERVIALRARSQSGKPSAKSAEAEGTALKVDASDLQVDLSLIAGATIWYQASQPTGAEPGDIWVDTDDGNRQRRFDGSGWVEITDVRIQAAVDAAATAQTTADGKIRTFAAAVAPTSGMSVGDLWVDLANGNRVNRYNGTAWVAYSVGDLAIASVSAAKITTGVMNAQVTLSGRIATAMTGTRVQMDATGIRAFIRLGGVDVETFSLVNGVRPVITGGLIRTGASGSRVQMDDSGMLTAYRDDESIAVRIFPSNDGSGANTGIRLGLGSALEFVGAESTGQLIKSSGASRATYLTAGPALNAGAGLVLFDNGAPGNGGDDSGGWALYTNNARQLYMGLDGVLHLRNSAYVVDSVPSASNAFYAKTTQARTTTRSSRVFALDDVNGDPWFHISSSGVLNNQGAWDNTTTNSPNLFVTSSGNFLRSTSLRKHKRDLLDVTDGQAQAVLNLRPRTWLDRGELEAKAPHATRNVGLVAEEVDKLGDADTLVLRDPQTGEIAGVAYDRLAVLMLPLVQQLWAERA